MPYDPAQLRLERFNVEIGYDAAFLYWNLRGVLAEKWAHGPVFGGWGENPGQTNINVGPNADDSRMTAAVGLKASGILGEGPVRAEEAHGLARQWLSDVYEVLDPKRTMRVSIHRFGLYPVDNPEQASRRLRSRFYRSDNLVPVLPDRVRDEHRDNFHSAIDCLVIEGEHDQTSLIMGVVGPPHRGSFFNWPDPERDAKWWLGLNYTTMRIVPDGERLDPPLDELEEVMGRGEADFHHIADTVLREVIP